MQQEVIRSQYVDTYINDLTMRYRYLVMNVRCDMGLTRTYIMMAPASKNVLTQNTTYQDERYMITRVLSKQQYSTILISTIGLLHFHAGRNPNHR